MRDSTDISLFAHGPGNCSHSKYRDVEKLQLIGSVKRKLRAPPAGKGLWESMCLPTSLSHPPSQEDAEKQTAIFWNEFGY